MSKTKLPKALDADAQPKQPERPQEPQREFIGEPVEGQQAALLREAYETLVATHRAAEEAKIAYQRLVLMIRPEDAHGFDVNAMRFFVVKE